MRTRASERARARARACGMRQIRCIRRPEQYRSCNRSCVPMLRIFKAPLLGRSLSTFDVGFAFRCPCFIGSSLLLLLLLLSYPTNRYRSMTSMFGERDDPRGENEKKSKLAARSPAGLLPFQVRAMPTVRRPRTSRRPTFQRKLASSINDGAKAAAVAIPTS